MHEACPRLLDVWITGGKHIFAGILIGIAVRSGNPLSLNLAEPIWKLLAGMELKLQDLSEIDKVTFLYS